MVRDIISAEGVAGTACVLPKELPSPDKLIRRYVGATSNRVFDLIPDRILLCLPFLGLLSGLDLKGPLFGSLEVRLVVSSKSLCQPSVGRQVQPHSAGAEVFKMIVLDRKASFGIGTNSALCPLSHLPTEYFLEEFLRSRLPPEDVRKALAKPMDHLPELSEERGHRCNRLLNPPILCIGPVPERLGDSLFVFPELIKVRVASLNIVFLNPPFIPARLHQCGPLSIINQSVPPEVMNTLMSSKPNRIIAVKINQHPANKVSVEVPTMKMDTLDISIWTALVVDVGDNGWGLPCDPADLRHGRIGNFGSPRPQQICIEDIGGKPNAEASSGLIFKKLSELGFIWFDS